MYTKEELLEIYKYLKIGKINKKELLPIKKELIFLVKNIKFNHLFMLNDLINVLLTLFKENKLSIINQELIDYIKYLGDDTYLSTILSGITYENFRLTNDIEINQEILYSLGISFHATSRILLKNNNYINYLNNINEIYASLASKYFLIKEKLLLKDYSKQDIYVLLNVLEIITTFVYVNIDSFNYQYDLIDKCMDTIENNILEYFIYFIENKLWSLDVGVFPKSVGGFKREFIVIGNIVNKIYLSDSKKIKL